MKTLKELLAEREQLLAEGEAIVQLATGENRELSADETARIDAIHAEIGTSDKPGPISQQILRMEKIETLKKDYLNGQGNRQKLEEVGGGIKAITIPAQAKRHGQLKAFGTDEQSAYVAGHVFAAQLYGNQRSQQWLNDHGITQALHTGEDSRGGVFVPVETETAIIRLVEQYGTIRSKSQKVQMGSDRKTVPVRTAGLTAYPVAETTTANQSSNTGTESEPTYGQVELIARKWKTLTRMSDELNEDALISMADQLSVEIALAFAYAEDNAGFNGDGTATYQGVVGIKNALLAGSEYTALAGNTSFATLDLVDFEGMVGQLPEFPNIMPEWYISKKGYYASMHRLQMAAGGNTSDNLQAGGRPMFLSFPVNFVQCMNSTLTTQTSTEGLCYLGDLSMGVLFGDRRGVQIKLTDQRYWDVDQIAVKSTSRFDINVHSRGTASACGAIVQLLTPGS